MKKAPNKVKTKPPKKRASKYEEKVSLYPLSFDEAMSMAIKSPPKDNNQ